MKHTDLFLCECHSPEHQFIVRYWDDAKEVYVDIHLTKAPFWQRVWYAIKYIFGYQSSYGAFDEIILNPEDAERLQKVVDHLRKCDFPGFEDTGVPGKDFVPVDWVETLGQYGKWKIVKVIEDDTTEDSTPSGND